MKCGHVIFVAMSIMVVVSIYSSSSFIPFQASAATEIKCERTGTVQVTCCQEKAINVGTPPGNPGTLVTYCTDCTIEGTHGYIPPIIKDCSERYIQMSAEEPPIQVPPAAIARLQEGEDFGEATTFPEGPVLEAQRANITILPGGIIQETNTSSNDSSSILGMEQSDLESDAEENITSSSDDEATRTEEEQEETQTTEKGASRQGDEPEVEVNIDEELPLE